MWREPQEATLVHPNGAEKPALRWLKGYLRGTAPIVEGPGSLVVTSGYAARTEVASFVAKAPSGASYPHGVEASSGVVPRPSEPTDASQAVAFDEGTGRLRLDGATLPAGTYSVRVFVDVDLTVSNLFDVELTVQ